MSNPIPIPPGRRRRPAASPTQSDGSNSSQSSRHSQSSNVSGGVFRMDPETQTQPLNGNNAQRGSPPSQALYPAPVVTHSQRFLDYQERTRRRSHREPTTQTSSGPGHSSPVYAPPPYSAHAASALHGPPPHTHQTGQVPAPYQPGRPPAQRAAAHVGASPPDYSAVQPPPSYASRHQSAPGRLGLQQRQEEGTSSSTPGQRGRGSRAAHVAWSVPPSQQQPRR